MNKLLPLILLCTLLCGCGQTDSSEEIHPPLPTEVVSEDLSKPEEYGGRVQIVPLNLSEVQGLRVLEDNILLFSGGEDTTLTLLDGKTLEVRAALTLDFLLTGDDPSLVMHPGGRLSFFDPSRNETRLLDSTLQEITRIRAPGALSGCPILSAEETTLFYCTPSHVRAWALDSGVHRCIRETASPLELTGVHMDGTILQCRIAREAQTVFLSAEDGKLLHRSSGLLSLSVHNRCYFAEIQAGSYSVPVFGSDPSFPMMLPPAEASDRTFFLPKRMAAVAAISSPDGTRLDYCRLSTGLLTHQITLPPSQQVIGVEQPQEDTLLFLVRDTAVAKVLLLFWDVRDCFAGTQTIRTIPYRTSDHPDTHGLARCAQTAAELGLRYGIRILLDTADTPFPSPVPETEHIVPILQQELASLERRLSQYPESLLRETADFFSSLTLCLVRSLPDTGKPACAQGTHFLDGRDAYLVIPMGTDCAQALYHQLFHLMEIRIFSKSKAFDRWESLNPAGFRYDYDYAANANRDSGVYLFEQNRVFVDTFSMSYPKEDRARIMESAMLPGNRPLFQPPAMQKKLQQLCDGIRDAYCLENWEDALPWEQYLQ